jgi:uncharacterized protein YukE
MPDFYGSMIKVPGDLDARPGQIMAIAELIGLELQDLRTKLMPLKEEWQGRANVDWEQLQTIWDTSAADLMTSSGTLGSIANTTQTNVVNYTDTELANMKSWNLA